MAEYREFHCPYGDDFEGGDECDRCEQYELCMETPSTDVVERRKIDKAIKEIDFLRQHRAKYITEDNKICIDSGEVLKILKNIGE